MLKSKTQYGIGVYYTNTFLNSINDVFMRTEQGVRTNPKAQWKGEVFYGFP